MKARSLAQIKNAIVRRFFSNDYKSEAMTLCKGNGLEIGALHNKFLKESSTKYIVEYLDVVDSSVSKNNFSELEPSSIQKPDYVGNVSSRSVISLTGKTYDFIICNHVIEHVPNPIKFIKNIFDGLNRGGLLLLSVPDKRFTFDKNRSSTSFQYLLANYYLDVERSTDDRFIDFLQGVSPEVFSNKESFFKALNDSKDRLEHVHVWTSSQFKSQLAEVLKFLGISFSIELESSGETNCFEYFVVLKKLSP